VGDLILTNQQHRSGRGEGKTTARTPSARKAKKAQDGLGARETALAVAAAGLDKKALNIEIIDVRGKVDYADYVVIMSGRSDRQVNAIAQGVQRDLRTNHGVRCVSVEGLPQGAWALMDFGDVVVHVFHEDTRGYYDLEALWIDAARLPLEEDAPAAITAD
jgi:ribosome-associated protein